MKQGICPRTLRLPNKFFPPEIVFAKKIEFQFLSKLLTTLFATLFLTGLLHPGIINARQSVGILSVNIIYPSKGLNWLKLFLREELSLQLQLADRFSVITPDTMHRWDQRNIEKGLLQANLSYHDSTAFTLLKPDRLLELSIQKVLSQLSVRWNIRIINENKSTDNNHAWATPDKLVENLLSDLEADPFFGKLTHFPQGYSWNGVRSFFQWKLKPVPSPGSEEWQKHKEELESLLLSHPSLGSSIKVCRAVMLILESSVSYPAHVPSLVLAEHDILAAIKRHAGNAEHHTLLSLIHYLRRAPLYAKQQANIAEKINPGNGMAMILYGLTIGKTPQAGTSFIKQGLQTYPFVAEPDSLGWQPYHVLVRDLEPWLVTSDSEKVLNYEQLMNSGKELYNDQRWNEARKFFEEASVLKPDLPEPALYRARLKLAQRELRTALLQLSKLQSRFPKDPEINLYLGYAHEQLKRHHKAEKLYRQVLHLKPKHHKALLRLGAVLIKLGKHGEARSFLESLTRKYPLYSVAWWNLGIVYLNFGEMELAESAWQECLRLEPENNQVRIRLEQLREEMYFASISN
jgi:tetratricopeptide (TPR) repeat protein